MSEQSDERMVMRSQNQNRPLVMMSENDSQVWLTTYGGFEPSIDYGPFVLSKDTAAAIVMLLKAADKSVDIDVVDGSEDEP